MGERYRNPAPTGGSTILPVVDVVILSLERVDLTLEAIESVIGQTGVKPVVWVVDQGSSEASIGKLRDFCMKIGTVSLIQLDENVGVAGGRNLGMIQGNSEVIVSIDNDAVFRDMDALSKTVSRFESDNGLGAIGFRIERGHSGEYDRGAWAYPRSQYDQRNVEFTATRFCGAGHAIRRSALEKTAMYDEDLFFYWEELDLSLQLISRGYTIIYDPRIVVLHQTSPDSRIVWEEWRYYYVVRNAIYLDFKYFRSLRRVLLLGSGYLIKGAYNRLMRQTLRAISDSFSMMNRMTKSDQEPLDERAKKYLQRYEGSVRGGLVSRVRNEVFERLPATQDQQNG